MNNKLMVFFWDQKNKKWLFFNDKKEFTSGDEWVDTDNGELCLILPDEFFYFFQTPINTRKRLKETLLAYTKNIFPIKQEVSVGYLQNIMPAVGYIFKKREVGVELLKRASLVTTPFLIEYVLCSFKKGEPFVYESESIISIVDQQGEITRYYLKKEKDKYKGQILKQYPYKLVNPTKTEVAEDFFQIIKEKHIKRILHLKVADPPDISWKRCVFTGIAMFLITLICFMGGYFRYRTYVNNLDQITSKINDLYHRALNGKDCIDPYGMLLYKAKVCSSGHGLSPLKLLFVLSKAKDGYIQIDTISYRDKVYNVKGKANSYEDLVNYVKRLKKLNIQAKILNTKKEVGTKQTNLRFEILCR